MKPKQLKFLAGSVVIVLALVYMGYTGFRSSMAYNQTVSEMLASKDSAFGRKIELQGDVLAGSIQRDGRIVTFKVHDKDDEKKVVTVRYVGREPLNDTFRDRATAMAKGTLHPDGVFVATDITAKCASKYEKEKAAGITVTKASLD